MTLRDILRLVGRYWYVIVVVTLVATGVTAAIILKAPSGDSGYSAVSRLVVNSQLNSVRGLAASEAREFGSAHKGYNATVGADGNTMTVAITVTGPDGSLCSQYANELAQSIEPQAKAFFEGNNLPLAIRVEQASSAERIGKGPDFSPIWITALIALGVSVIAVTAIGKLRRPVMDVEGIQDAVKLPVLEAFPAADGKRLLANIRFAAKNDGLASVYVVPVQSDRATGSVCELLADSAGKRGDGVPGILDVVRCKPLDADPDALYGAREADAAIVSVEKWKDTVPALKSTVAELKIADVNLVGMVYVTRSK